MAVFIKRFFDIIVALCALIIFSPIMIIVSIAIVLESGRPLFFRQVRIGEKCQRFSIYKFRSMVNRANVSQGDLSSTTGLDRDALKAMRAAYQTTSKNDARVTKVGRFIRKTHLDELPQLFNVLLGHMSIVGPRPDAPVQEADYPAKYWKERHKIKPGITGLAQTNPKIATTITGRLALDILYVRQWSLGMDVCILMKTAFKVFKANSF